MAALQFELTKKPSIAKFLNKLDKKLNLHVRSQQYSLKTYYDSFDWRLYRADLICELNQSKTESSLSLINRHSGECVAYQAINEVPKFAQEFDPTLRNHLAPILDIRALLSITTLPYHRYQIDVFNKHQKPVANLLIEEHELLNNRIYILPIDGCAKHARRIGELLTQEFNLPEAKFSLFKEALKLQGRKPKDYSSKTRITLQPDMRSDLAGQTIFKHLLAQIKANEAGTISDIDSEFLHDLRVAVRKTRSGLNQLKDIYPSEITKLFSEYFAWLGQVTSETRDMDVYLLNFQDYKNSLPKQLRNDLNPLFDFILGRQQNAQLQLAEILRGGDHLNALAKWEQFINQPVGKKLNAVNARLPIKSLADQRIWKTYKKIIKDGTSITDQSAPECLHDLRKTGKKLRYLLEFFQTLYPEKDIKVLIKALKGLQDILGDFQDYEVQELTLKQFSQEMRHMQLPEPTYTAIELLVKNLKDRRIHARRHFADHFADFTCSTNQQLFKSLFCKK